MTQAEITTALQEQGCTIVHSNAQGVIARLGTARMHAVAIRPAGLWWLAVMQGGDAGGFHVEEREDVRDALAYMGLVEAAPAAGVAHV
jgi:hypothetical protein